MDNEAMKGVKLRASVRAQATLIKKGDSSIACMAEWVMVIYFPALHDDDDYHNQNGWLAWQKKKNANPTNPK